VQAPHGPSKVPNVQSSAGVLDPLGKTLQVPLATPVIFLPPSFAAVTSASVAFPPAVVVSNASADRLHDGDAVQHELCEASGLWNVTIAFPFASTRIVEM
jgi:hypothetical protein